MCVPSYSQWGAKQWLERRNRCGEILRDSAATNTRPPIVDMGNQEARTMNISILDRLLEILYAERNESVPQDLSDAEKALHFRALCNVRPPKPVSDVFLRLQDAYLSETARQRGTVSLSEISFIGNVGLWRGDITRLKVDAIMNACNPALLGCFHPLHDCIDNVIHSNAGVQVRLDCNKLMQGGLEPNGEVEVTKAYNLPSRYIFHTVGPIVQDRVTDGNRNDLRRCYRSCLRKAGEMGLGSFACCCISTGVYRFPQELAASIAVGTVRDWLEETGLELKVVFNVFTEKDYAIYRRLLTTNRASLH